MHKIYSRILLIGAVIGLATCLWFQVRGASESAPSGSDTLTVMTFNLRYASATPPNAWAQRRPVMRECIEKISPDVFGTQEGLYNQLKDMASDLPQYAWIGLGRDGGSRGEFMAVFYRTNRLEPLAFDHFWLSDTPEVIGSSTWGNSNRRMVTWVKFLDRQSRQSFYFFNTHLDHQVQLAREKGAALIRQRIEALKTDLPVLLVGDFNATAGANQAYTILTGDGFLSDTWTTAALRRGEGLNTFHGFSPLKKDGIRIDWILSRGVAKINWEEIVVFEKNGQYPSDHLPVAAQIQWP
jgi:endonuclease/exonuclease/phosphatase family metal-dependent hydrolase